jgi:hypothetical protein
MARRERSGSCVYGMVGWSTSGLHGQCESLYGLFVGLLHGPLWSVYIMQHCILFRAFGEMGLGFDFCRRLSLAPDCPSPSSGVRGARRYPEG